MKDIRVSGVWIRADALGLVDIPAQLIILDRTVLLP